MPATQLKTVEQGAEQRAFNMALDVLRAKQASLAFIKTDAKEANKAVTEAARAAAWAAFDLMRQSNDWATHGEAHALEIAKARDVAEGSLKVYAQRGRDMATFHGKISEADRSKADPLTLAKKFRASKDDKMAQRAADAVYMQEARELAIAALAPMSPAEFDAALVSVDGQDEREALDNALNLCRKRGEVLNVIRDAVATLKGADADTIAKAKEIFGLVD